MLNDLLAYQAGFGHLGQRLVVCVDTQGAAYAPGPSSIELALVCQVSAWRRGEDIVIKWGGHAVLPQSPHALPPRRQSEGSEGEAFVFLVP